MSASLAHFFWTIYFVAGSFELVDGLYTFRSRKRLSKSWTRLLRTISASLSRLFYGKH